MTEEKKLRRLAALSAGLAVALGILALAGLWLHIGVFRSLYPGWRPMGPNSALCFVLSGTALLALHGTEKRYRVLIAQALALVVILLASFSLLTFVAGLPPTFSNLLFRAQDPRDIGRARVPLNTTLPFIITGLGIVCLNVRRRSWLTLSNWLALLVANFALITLVGNLLNPAATANGMSQGSIFGFLFLGTSLLLTRFNPQLLGVFSRAHPLGFIAFRLVLFGVTVPLVIYGLAAWWLLPLIPAQNDVAALTVLILSALLFGTIASLLKEMESMDRQRRDAEGSRDALLARMQHQAANLEIQVAERTRRLHESTSRLQLALHSGDYGVFDWDVSSGLQVWDERQCAIYGIKPDKFDGRIETWLSHLHPDDLPKARPAISERGSAHTIGSSNNYEFRIIRPDGKVRHLSARTTLHFDAEGKVSRMVGLNKDVTEEREREHAITALNQRLLFVLNATGYGVWKFDYATEGMDWDDRLLAIYGLKREELTGHVRDWESRLHPDDLPTAVADIDRTLVTGAIQLDHTFRIVWPDGSVRYIASHGYLLRGSDGKPESMVGFDSDITDAHDLREELRITEERWQLALAGNNDGVWDWNLKTGKVYRNARFAEILGYSTEELKADSHIWRNIGHPEDTPMTEAAIADHIEGRKPVYQCEYRLRHKAGHWVWVLDRGKVVARDAQGLPLRIVGTHTDVTPRKQLEERLRHGEEMSLQLSRLAQIGAWEWEIASKRVTWSPEMFRIHEVDLGFEPTIEKSLDFYRDQAQETLREALRSASEDGIGFDLELPMATARGHKLWVRMLGRAEVKDGKASRVYGAFQDITARRDAEEMRRHLEGQLFQAQKMDTLGTLAGGIAHDFNNLLTGILGYQELALETIAEGDPVREFLSSAREASLRARELIDHILTFSRQSGSEKLPVDVGQLIDDAGRFLRATVPATIRIEVAVSKDCGRVLADATQLHQVLLNLGSNAAHAMHATGGTMHIGLTSVYLDEAKAHAVNQKAAGSYLMLTFRDRGHGMDEETSRRIFDPFFTTKEVGQGTGLGLSVVHGIIQAHHGSIMVESAVGKGTTFTIYLPEVPKVEETTDEDSGESIPRGTGELIAMVDDEDIVRSLAQMALEKLGYRVASFESPVRCLEVLRHSPDDFALLLTDQTMPVMKGIELASEARTVAPHLPVVIMSGYFSRISPEKLAQIGHVTLLSKPFTNEELAVAVHRSITSET
jgi:PAS domain S-box-containing protein